jgi:hypothetical protein
LALHRGLAVASSQAWRAVFFLSLILGGFFLFFVATLASVGIGELGGRNNPNYSNFGFFLYFGPISLKNYWLGLALYPCYAVLLILRKKWLSFLCALICCIHIATLLFVIVLKVDFLFGVPLGRSAFMGQLSSIWAITISVFPFLVLQVFILIELYRQRYLIISWKRSKD